MQGDQCFKGTRAKSKLNKMLISNRHIGLNVIMSFQSSKSMPRVIRSQIDVFCIGDINDDKLVEEIYYEIADSQLTKEQFVKMFTDVHQEPYRFLVIDYSAPRDKMYLDTFERVISLEKYISTKKSINAATTTN
jgi:hypothetical protein